MNRKDNKFKKFFRDLWERLEPFAIEFAVFAIVTLTLAGVTYLTEPFIDEEYKDKLHILKMAFIIGAFSLLMFFALIDIFISRFFATFNDGKKKFRKLKPPNKKSKAKSENEETKPNSAESEENDETDNSDETKPEK